MVDQRVGPTHDREEETIGWRIRRFRTETRLTLTELAEKAGVSKSYLSELESGTDGRPSADTLYKIADVLGVAMSDILGRPILVRSQTARPPGLVEFALEANLPETDVVMLESIQFRGELPTTKERWRFIYEAIRNSRGIDDDKRQNR